VSIKRWNHLNDWTYFSATIDLNFWLSRSWLIFILPDIVNLSWCSMPNFDLQSFNFTEWSNSTNMWNRCQQCGLLDNILSFECNHEVLRNTSNRNDWWKFYQLPCWHWCLMQQLCFNHTTSYSLHRSNRVWSRHWRSWARNHLVHHRYEHWLPYPIILGCS